MYGHKCTPAHVLPQSLQVLRVEDGKINHITEVLVSYNAVGMASIVDKLELEIL